MFCIWANQVLKEFIIKGYVMNNKKAPMLPIFIVRSVGLFYLFLCAALWHMNMFNVITLFVL